MPIINFIAEKIAPLVLSMFVGVLLARFIARDDKYDLVVKEVADKYIALSKKERDRGKDAYGRLWLLSESGAMILREKDRRRFIERLTAHGLSDPTKGDEIIEHIGAFLIISLCHAEGTDIKDPSAVLGMLMRLAAKIMNQGNQKAVWE